MVHEYRQIGQDNPFQPLDAHVFAASLMANLILGDLRTLPEALTLYTCPDFPGVFPSFRSKTGVDFTLLLNSKKDVDDR